MTTQEINKGDPPWAAINLVKNLNFKASFTIWEVLDQIRDSVIFHKMTQSSDEKMIIIYFSDTSMLGCFFILRCLECFWWDDPLQLSDYNKMDILKGTYYGTFGTQRPKFPLGLH